MHQQERIRVSYLRRDHGLGGVHRPDYGREHGPGAENRLQLERVARRQSIAAEEEEQSTAVQAERAEYGGTGVEGRESGAQRQRQSTAAETDHSSRRRESRVQPCRRRGQGTAVQAGHSGGGWKVGARRSRQRRQRTAAQVGRAEHGDTGRVQRWRQLHQPTPLLQPTSLHQPTPLHQQISVLQQILLLQQISAAGFVNLFSADSQGAVQTTTDAVSTGKNFPTTIAVQAFQQTAKIDHQSIAIYAKAITAVNTAQSEQ